jgi:hypothetical protein
LILAGGFLVIGLWPMIFRHRVPTKWALAASVIFGIAGVIIPAALRQLYRMWMTAGDLLGWINSRVILSALYFSLLTPVRLLMKITGYDAMNRKFDQNAATYRVRRSARPPSHMTHQF